MLEWKKSLASFDNDIVGMIADYISSKITPLALNETGRKNVAELVKKFDTSRILDGIDEAAKKYIKYDAGQIDKASADTFIKK